MDPKVREEHRPTMTWMSWTRRVSTCPSPGYLAGLKGGIVMAAEAVKRLTIYLPLVYRPSRKRPWWLMGLTAHSAGGGTFLGIKELG